MADKLESVMKPVLEQINAFLPQGKFDASKLTLEVCNRLLSTHTLCDWTLLNPLRERQAQLMNEAVIEVSESELLNNPTVSICPSEIFSGMFMLNHGYIGKVTKVKRFENNENSAEPFIYVVSMEYVCGDLSMHKYFTSSINRGTAKGYLSNSQGNRLATFTRVLTDA
jgi:hypothetical protein